MELPAASHRFCIAPMMDWSDRHCRYFWRLLSRRARLYTEMVTTGALLNGDAHYHLAFDPSEHPVALQLGGSEPAELAQAARLGEDYGYNEINLNVGCPSDRVKKGRFGASLMNDPELVARCMDAMREAVAIPVTIKCRIGVDDNDSYEALIRFIDINRQAGCKVFIVHARKAILSGLSPRQNREIPPLKYPVVHQLKQQFPDLQIILNGGLKSIAACEQQLAAVDGVMLGREAYQNPWMLSQVDAALFGEAASPFASPMDVALAYADYLARELDTGTSLHHMTRHLLGLFTGLPGARGYRRHLSEHASKPGAGLAVFHEALQQIRGVDTVARQ